MAGQLASLPLSIQLNDNARPFDGALLYLYDAGTSTPAVFYEDFATTIVLSWPLVADISGRIPMFWVQDGSYRVRLTDNAGNEIFDINSITAVGPSSGTSGGSSVSADQIFQTGDPIWLPINTTRSGWVRGNGLTIGSSSSGASERANADCQSLFEYLWNTFADSLCTVTGGRGGSAVNDWNANKRITTLDMRGSCAFGLDTMGNVAAGRISVATSAGVLFGAQTATLAQTNLPAVNFNVSLSAAAHAHGAGSFAVGSGITNGTNVTRGLSLNTSGATGGGIQLVNSNFSFTNDTISLTTPTVSGLSASSGALAVSGTVASGGSATPVSTVPPGRAGTWYFKL